MQLTSINVGQQRTQQKGSELEITGIYKIPTQASVRVGALGLSGDFIASTKHHGGPDQAVYVYGGADYAWWSRELGKEILPGTFGDNLTIAELESALFNVGDFLHIGKVTLQVTAPRIPCATFAARMGDPMFVKRFRRAERPGLYCRVIREGTITAAETVSIEEYPGDKLPTIELFRDYYRRNKREETLRRFLNAPLAIRAREDIERDLEQLLLR